MLFRSSPTRQRGLLVTAWPASDLKHGHSRAHVEDAPGRHRPTRRIPRNANFSAHRDERQHRKDHDLSAFFELVGRQVGQSGQHGVFPLIVRVRKGISQHPCQRLPACFLRARTIAMTMTCKHSCNLRPCMTVVRQCCVKTTFKDHACRFVTA